MKAAKTNAYKARKAAAEAKAHRAAKIERTLRWVTATLFIAAVLGLCISLANAQQRAFEQCIERVSADSCYGAEGH
jgi:hypothetical protein